MKRLACVLGLAALLFGACEVKVDDEPDAPGTPGAPAAEAHDAKYITLTAGNFQQEVLSSDQPVLVDFWATWCPPCVAMAPTIEQLAVQFEGRAKVGKLNVDEHQAIAEQYQISSIPALFIFHKGEVVEKVIGLTAKDELAGKLEAALKQR